MYIGESVACVAARSIRTGSREICALANVHESWSEGGKLYRYKHIRKRLDFHPTKYIIAWQLCVSWILDYSRIRLREAHQQENRIWWISLSSSNRH